MKILKTTHIFDVLGFGLIVLISLFYMRHSLIELDLIRMDRMSHGNYITVGYGDVMVRDLPKANSFLTDGFFDDPNYEKEVNWYPFITPYIVSIVARTTSTPPYFAYLLTGIVISSVSIITIALFLRFQFGKIGYILYPILLSIGKNWPDNGYYPFQTARVPFLIYLILAGAFLNYVLNQKEGTSNKSAIYLSIGLGVMNGVLGLWHGASFYVAAITSLVIIILCVIKFRLTAQMAFFFLFTFVISLSPLLLPQIIHYGHYQTADDARLWLDERFEGGSQPDGLFLLKLLPTGGSAVFLALFVLLYIAAQRSQQYKLAPLAICYVVAKTLAHLGFVVNSIEYPWLAALSKQLLVAPPHTLDTLANDLLTVIKIVVICMCSNWIIQGSEKIIRPLNNRFFILDDLNLKLPVFALIISCLIFSVHHPLQSAFLFSAIDQDITLFASEVEKLVGPNETVIDANMLIGFSSIKILYTGSSQHSNPYVNRERSEAQRLIDSGVVSSMNEVINKYDIRYAVVNSKQPSMVSKFCKKETLLNSKDSEYQLISLKTCSPSN